MLFRKRLTGKRIAALVADGFEQVELTAPMRALLAEGAKADVISLRHGKIRGMNLHVPGRKVRVDRTLEEVSPVDYDALLIPGGYINPDLLRQSRDARLFVERFEGLGKPIATLCHGPWLLASAELVRGRELTSWPGIRDDLVHAGAVWRDEATVRDQNWITSRGPQDLRAFVRGMIDLFADRAPIRVAPAQPAAISAPPRTSPPFMVLAASALVPGGSITRRFLRAGAALAAAATVIFALRRAAA